MRARDRYRGWLLYDGDCALCQTLVRRFRVWIHALGYRPTPLQQPWVARHLGMSREEVLRAVRLLTRDGRHLAGVDVYIRLLRDHPATWPLAVLLSLPGPYHGARRCYDWVEQHRDLVLASLPLSERHAGSCRI